MKTSSKTILTKIGNIALAVGLALAFAPRAHAQTLRAVPGHVVAATANLQAVGSLPATDKLHLYLGLPLRNQAELDETLRALQDPASPTYRHWLTPEQFTERFGPSPEDYDKVVRYAAQQGFTVTHTHANRMMVNVDAPVAAVEKAFNLKMRRYAHPTENRTFYAPDAEPNIDASVPLLHVAGLDNFTLPHRLSSAKVRPLDSTNITAYATGSSPGGFFMGNDFRTAYVPGVTNTGKGQFIAVIDVGGPYYPKDVYMYQTNAGLSTNITITNVLLSGWTGIPVGATNDEGEEVLDIDMAMSMAPEATIMNYEGEGHDVFNQIALDNMAKQMTLSYGFGIDSIIQQIFQQFVAQGQAMSQASGDGGADPSGGTGLTGAPYSTIVGGVSLSTRGAGGPWQNDNTWGGSGGGISGYGIPDWQQGINMTTNLGSVSFRNYPDVSMPADNVFTVYRNGTVIGGTGGTSAASPLWAGFMALVNQASEAQGQGPVGFVNPAIYAIGKGPRSIYTNCFHDIATGNTFNTQFPTRYVAYPGYDLCTGWGSPTGSNTINALIGTGTNDFTFYPAQAVFNLVSGGSAAATITMARLNGLQGSVTYTISGFSDGVAVTLNQPTTTNVTSMSVTTTTATRPGTYTGTLTGVLGGLSHSVALSVVVSAPIPGSTTVDLSAFYNRNGLVSDGSPFSGGLDGSAYSYSASLLGASLSWSGLLFNIGPANTSDVVSCSGQVIPLPAGNFNSLQILATAVQGNRTSQSFIVTYTDNTTSAYTQSISDWATPQNYFGESSVVKMSYRNASDGTSDSINVSLFGYGFALDQTKTVKSLTLPHNANVVLVSAALGTEPIAVPLSTYYNRIGIYRDGSTYPATGGIDGVGNSYSGNLLGGSQTWNNTAFYFGPQNALNVVSATNQTIALHPGNYTYLRLLATAVSGGKSLQQFVVTYTDNSTTTFMQSMSDCIASQNYPGEVKAVTMDHRNTSGGGKDSRTVYLYGYTFSLNSSKSIQSLKLPNNAGVIITAISMIPNWTPSFSLNPFALPAAHAGQTYIATVTTNASDLNSNTLTYAKVSGPAWLNVAGSGTVSGQPSSADVGDNSFVISATDPGNATATATLGISVLPAPPILSTIAPSGPNLSLSWTGGVAPFQVQVSTNLGLSGWTNLGDPSPATNLLLTPSNAAAFYRILGQ